MTNRFLNKAKYMMASENDAVSLEDWLIHNEYRMNKHRHLISSSTSRSVEKREDEELEKELKRLTATED